MSLLVVGCTVVDVIFPDLAKLPTWPDHTEFTRDNLSLATSPPIVSLGGNGAVCAYVAAHHGADVELHTQIGTDDMGHLARSWLEDQGVTITGRRVRATALNATAANRELQRATFFYPGSAVSIPPGRKTPRLLLVCGWPHPPLTLVGNYFQKAQRRGTFTALDAGPILGVPWTLRQLSHVFSHLDLLLANEFEVCQITGCPGLSAALQRLRMHFSGHVVVKRGGQGACWVEAESARVENFPAIKVTPVNTVGAGDSFNGGLLAALSGQENFRQAIGVAIKTAAQVVASRSGVLGVFSTKSRNYTRRGRRR